MSVFDVIDGLIEVNGFGCIVKQADLMTSMYQSTEPYTHKSN
jgi:hypothetical protein